SPTPTRRRPRTTSPGVSDDPAPGRTPPDLWVGCRSRPGGPGRALRAPKLCPVSAQPGWYPDPGGGKGLYRYWDGRAWSAATTANPHAAPPNTSLTGAATPTRPTQPTAP